MSAFVTITTNEEDKKNIIKPTEPKRVISYVIYAKVSSFNEFVNATHLDNREVYFVNLEERAKDLQLGVVSIMGIKYELYTRKVQDTATTYFESRTEITKPVFDSLKQASALGYKYKFYEFPALHSDLKWEVCVFMGKDGLDHPWVRIEVDLKDKDTIIPELPFKITQCIVEHDADNTTEINEFIQKLWAKEYALIDQSDLPAT